MTPLRSVRDVWKMPICIAFVWVGSDQRPVTAGAVAGACTALAGQVPTSLHFPTPQTI